jgi:cysteine desulfurase
MLEARFALAPKASANLCACPGKAFSPDSVSTTVAFKDKKRIFLDYASSTPVAPEVLDAMMPYLRGNFANPSALYQEAMEAKDVVDIARGRIADVLKARKDEIVFTGSGTESDNLAILGVFQAYLSPDFTPHIIVSAVEHPAIMEACVEIRRSGGEVTILPVSEEGLVSVADLRAALKDNTVLVSVMYANNEIGTIQPIREIVKAVKEFRQTHDSELPYVHTDACQAALYLPLDTQKLGVDLMTLDGIKMYGPRGVGVLYVRGGTHMLPVVFGGGQEGGLRSGTENVPGIAGMAAAVRLAEKMRESESARLLEIRDYAIDSILKTFPHARLNGSRTERLPNNINICFCASSAHEPASSTGKPGLDAEFAVISLDVAGIACSYSSSCRTLKENSSSYVIEALGKPSCASSSLRFTLGRETTKGDIDVLVKELQKIVK